MNSKQDFVQSMIFLCAVIAMLAGVCLFGYALGKNYGHKHPCRTEMVGETSAVFGGKTERVALCRE